MNEPSTPIEAYVAEILSEFVPIKSAIKQATDDMNIRIGITQQIIESHLEQANQTLALYTQNATYQSISIENELAQAKKELAHLTNRYLKSAVTQSLLDAHHQLQQKPAKPNKQTLLITVFIASLTSGFVGGILGLTSQYWSNAPLSPQQQQAMAQGQLLLQAWPNLDPKTQTALNKAINAQ